MAFGYIERVIKSDFFSRKRPIYLYMCATGPELPSYKSIISSPKEKTLLVHGKPQRSKVRLKNKKIKHIKRPTESLMKDKQKDMQKDIQKTTLKDIQKDFHKKKYKYIYKTY